MFCSNPENAIKINQLKILASSCRFSQVCSCRLSQLLAGSHNFPRARTRSQSPRCSLCADDRFFYDNLFLLHQVSQIVVTAVTTNYGRFLAVPPLGSLRLTLLVRPPIRMADTDAATSLKSSSRGLDLLHQII